MSGSDITYTDQPTQCPVCSSTDTACQTAWNSHTSKDMRRFIRQRVCHSCGSAWQDRFEIVGYKLTNHGPDNRA